MELSRRRKKRLENAGFGYVPCMDRNGPARSAPDEKTGPLFCQLE
jgi:hypothetical protein